MSYFKKFCDLVGGIGTFFATVFVLGRYMEYKPGSIAEGESKLKMFFSHESSKDYRQYLIFIALLVLAVIIGRALKRLPCVTLAVSVLPLCQIMGMLWRNKIYANGDFYVMVSIVLVVGNIYELITCDHASSKQGTIAQYLLGGLGIACALLSAGFSSFAEDMSQKLIDSELSESEMLLEKKLLPFGIDILADVPEKEVSALISMAAFLALALLVYFLLRKIKMPMPLLDVILASVPLLAAVFSLHAENLNTSPMLAIVPIAVYFFTNVAFLAKRR
jgi:hypothetical protein